MKEDIPKKELQDTQHELEALEESLEYIINHNYDNKYNESGAHAQLAQSHIETAIIQLQFARTGHE